MSRAADIVGWSAKLEGGNLAVFCHQCKARHLPEIVAGVIRAGDALAARACSQCGDPLRAGPLPVHHAMPRRVM